MSASIHSGDPEPLAGVFNAADPSTNAGSPSNRFAPFVNMEFTSLKTLQFPVARIKKIMKSDEDVSMISGEVPVLFSKACELFILDMTQQAYQHTLHCKRRTLQLNDIAAAVSQCSLFDFLIDIVQPTNNESQLNGEAELNSLTESAVPPNVSLSSYFEQQNPNVPRQMLPSLGPPFEE